MEGLLNLDKPQGMTSHDVVQRVRRVSGMRRVGHAGTLDPLATGVLLVCIGRTTRLIEYLMGQPKRYTATVRLGQTTDSYDAEGEIVQERPFAHLTRDDVEAVLPHFRGDIQQQPPMFSALKRNGQPLYKLAREGKEVERPFRPVTISRLEITQFDLPNLDLLIDCSTGTYIRSLAHDIGEMLGSGGHITALRRTAIGAFGEGEALSLDELTPDSVAAALQPSDQAVAHLPAVTFDSEETEDLQNGRRPAQQPEQPTYPLVRAYAENGRFLGMVVGENGRWLPKKMFTPQQ